MRYLFIFFLFGVLLPCQLSGKNKRKNYTQLISKIVSIINQSSFKRVIMVSTDSVDIYSIAIGYSDIRNRRLLKIHNKFIIGSLSKQFTAMLILRECKKGHLSLEDSINTIGYEENENKTLFFEINSLDLHNYVATGGFISNVVDLKKWNQLFYSGPLVKVETLKLMSTRYTTRGHPIFEEIEFGYSLLFKEGEENLQIGVLRYTPGFVSINFFYPNSKINVIVLDKQCN